MVARILALLAVATAAACARPAPTAAEAAPPAIGLDHVPIAVGDLDQAKVTFGALGFVLKPGRPHPNGLRNAHVKFADGTSLELITAPAEPTDGLTAEYRAFIDQGDGPAFLALGTDALGEVAATLKAAGVEVQRAPGIVAFPPGHRLRHLFFWGAGRSPSDRPEHYAHPNGAQGLTAVWLAAEDLAPERELLARFGITTGGVVRLEPLDAVAHVAPVANGAVYLLQRSGRRVAGATVRVRSLTEARAALPPGAGVVETPSSLFLPPAAAHGLWLELRGAPLPEAAAHGG